MPRQQVNHLKLISNNNWSVSHHLIQLKLGFQRNFRQEFSPYVSHGHMPSVYPDHLPSSSDLERLFEKHAFTAGISDQLIKGKHTIHFGVSADYQYNRINGWSFLVPSFRQQTFGAFVHEEFRLNQRTTLHGALRLESHRLETERYRDWFLSPSGESSSGVSEYLARASALVRNFSSLVWLAGLNFTKDRVHLKASVGKSFRVPIAKELAANGVNYHYFSYEVGNPSIAPEQSYQTDISVGWKNEATSFQISPFYNYFPNYIYLNPTSGHDYNYGAGNQVFRYAQSRVIRFGGEVRVAHHIRSDLEIGAAGEYLYNRQISGDKKGYTLPFSPPPTLLTSLTYKPASPDTKIKNTYLSIDYLLAAPQNRIVPPERKTPGYALIHFQSGTCLSLFGQSFDISFQIQNLLNTKYMNHTSFYRLIQLPETGRNLVLGLKMPLSIIKQ